MTTKDTNEHRKIVPAALGKRLIAYSAAAAATGLGAHQNTAEAAQIRHDIPDVTVGFQPGLLFNMVTGSTAVAATSFGNTAKGVMRLIGYYSSSFPHPYIYAPAGDYFGAFAVNGTTPPNSFPAAAFLGFGVPVDSNLTLSAVSSSTLGARGNYVALGSANWPATTRGFLGFRFELAGAAHFGWAEVTRNAMIPNGITLHAFGYNDVAGQAAITGVPGPGGLALLAVGAAGLPAWRRRRKASAA